MPRIITCSVSFDMQIHEHVDWPKFRYKIDDFIETLERIKAKKIQLNTLIDSPSSHMFHILMQEMLISHKHDEMAYILKDVVNNYNEPLTQERLFTWHHELFKLYPPQNDEFNVGAYRDFNVRFELRPKPFGAVFATRLPEEMNKFLVWFNDKSIEPELYIKAAIAHLYFLTIHPLGDGNGRISRAISDYLLINIDGLKLYSLGNEIIHNKKIYCNELEAAQNGDLDVTRWIMWFLNKIECAIDCNLGSLPIYH